MPGLMDTFEKLTEEHREIAQEMANAAREVLKQHDRAPDCNDHAARFDEACAVYLLQSRPVNPLCEAQELLATYGHKLTMDEVRRIGEIIRKP